MSHDKPSSKNDGELLTKRQAAELLSVSTRTIDRWLKDGVLPRNAKVIYGGSSRFVTRILLAKINNAEHAEKREIGPLSRIHDA